MNAVHLETNIDALQERLIKVVLQQSAQIAPELVDVILDCSILHWFDAQVVGRMHPPEKSRSMTPEDLLAHFKDLPFCEPNPSRPETWRFKEDFRKLLLEHEAVRARLEELHQRAANLFRGLLDEKNLVGEPRFSDPDWKDYAAEWIYHLLQLNPEEAIHETRKICAQALGVLTYGEQPEVIFCSDFLSKLHWSDLPDRAKEDIAFLRNGINALAAYQGPNALPLLYDLADIPGLTSGERGGILDWTGQIHLYDEWLIDRALGQFRKAEEAMPEDAYVKEHISESYSYPGILSGRIDLARQYAEKSGELELKKSNSLVLLGDLAKLQEDWQTAIELYQQASRVEPDSYTSYLRLSELYAEKGEVKNALAMIDKASEISPYIKYFALIRKGNVYTTAGRYQDSIAFYRQAIDDSSDRPDAYIGMGDSFAALWKLTEAEGAYQKAIEQDAGSEDAYLGWAILYQQRGDIEQAIQKCRQALEVCSTKNETLVLLRNIYSAQLQLDEMKQVRDQLVNLDAANAYPSHCEVGKAWLEKAWQSWNSPERDTWLNEAQKEFELARAMDPNLAWAYICLADLAILRLDPEMVERQKQLLSEKAPWAKYEMLLDLGKAYLKNLQYGEAKEILEAAIALSPHRAWAWKVLGDWYDRHGDAQGVVQAWTKIVELNPTMAYESHLNAGYTYEKVIDYEKAQSEYMAAIEENSNRPDARQALANLYLLDENWEAAIQECQNIVSANPGLAYSAYLGIVQAFTQQEEFDAAEQALRTAIELDPNDPAGYIRLAYLGASSDRQTLIEEGHSGVRSVSPESLYDLYLAVGDEYRQQDEETMAESYYKKGLKHNRDKPDAYVRLGVLAIQQEKYPKAKRWLNKALDIDSRNLEAYQVLSQLYEIQGKLDQVIETKERINALDPAERYNSNRIIGGMFEEVERTEEAEKWYRAAIDLAPWRADAYIDLGSLLLKTGRDSEAKDIYQQVKTRANVDYLTLGQYYEQQNLLKNALTIYHLGIDYAPDDEKASFYFALAGLLIKLGEFDEAEIAYQQVVEVAPLQAYDAYGLLGNLYTALQEDVKAEQAYRQAIELDPERSECYYLLAQMLVARDRSPEAIRVIRQMAQQPILAYDAYLYLGDLYAEQRDEKNAGQAYRRAIKLESGQAEGYVALVQMLADGGQRPEAIQVVNQMASHPGLAYSAQLSLGILHAGQKDGEQAVRAYRQAIELEPGIADAYLSLANWYQSQEMQDQAEEVLHQALEKAPKDAQVYRQLAELCEERGNWDEALRLYRRAAELQPDGELAAIAHEKIGNLLLDRKEYGEAERELQKSLEIAPKYGLAYRDLSRLYGEQQDLKSVKKMAQGLLGLELNPEEEYEARQIIAEAYDRAGDPQSAIREYQQAIELFPERTETILLLGSLYDRLQQYSLAEQTYRQAIEVAPGQAYDAYGFLGTLYDEQGDAKQAEQAYRMTIELDPERSEGYLVLAQMLVERDRRPEAIQVIRQMAQQPVLAYNAQIMLGNLYADQGDGAQAEQAFRQAIELEPEQAEGYLALAQKLADDDKRPEAIQVVEQMARHPGLAYSAQLSLGNLHADLGEGEAAERAYRQAIELEPGKADAYLSLADWYRSRDERSRSEEVLRQALEKAPQDAQVHQMLAELCEKRGNWDEALRLYRRAVELQPGGDLAALVHEQIGSLLLDRKEYGEAERELRQSLEIAPMYGLAYRDLARLYGEKQDLKGIVKLSQQIFSLDLTQDDEYEAHLIVADAYERAEIYVPAVDELKKAIKLQPQRWEANFQLGGIYEAQGGWESARKEYAKIGKLNPQFEPEIRLRIAQLWWFEGNLEQAEKNYRQTISLSPNQSAAYFDLAQLYADTNREDKAVDLYRQAAGLGLDSATSALLNIGSIYRKSGKLEEMRKVCAEVVSRVNEAKDPDSSNIRRLGVAHLMRGEFPEANRAFLHALEKDNTNASARLYLAVSLTASGEPAEAKQQLEKGIQQAQSQDDFIYPIEEASALAKRLPDDQDVQALLQALSTARDGIYSA